MVQKFNHENTGSIQDALTWTYESQAYKAETYQNQQATWQEHVPSYFETDNHVEFQFPLTQEQKGIKMGQLALTCGLVTFSLCNR